jgi:hypothetical protein
MRFALKGITPLTLKPEGPALPLTFVSSVTS